MINYLAENPHESTGIMMDEVDIHAQLGSDGTTVPVLGSPPRYRACQRNLEAKVSMGPHRIINGATLDRIEESIPRVVIRSLITQEVGLNYSIVWFYVHSQSLVVKALSIQEKRCEALAAWLRWRSFDSQPISRWLIMVFVFDFCHYFQLCITGNLVCLYNLVEGSQSVSKSVSPSGKSKKSMFLQKIVSCLLQVASFRLSFTLPCPSKLPNRASFCLQVIPAMHHHPSTRATCEEHVRTIRRPTRNHRPQ